MVRIHEFEKVVAGALEQLARDLLGPVARGKNSVSVVTASSNSSAAVVIEALSAFSAASLASLSCFADSSSLAF